MRPGPVPDDPALAKLAERFGAERLAERLRREGWRPGQAAGSEAAAAARARRAERLVRGGLALAGLLGRAQRNALAIACREHAVRVPGLPPAFDGFTLLQLSDLHLDSGPHFVDHLITAVRGLRHDLCVLTGDFRFALIGPQQPALDALARLRPHLGEAVVAVLGNHDSIRMVPAIEALRIRVLLNECLTLRRGAAALTLAGIDDAYHFRTHDLGRALQGRPAGCCTLLLSHAPDAYREAAAAGVNLMLCGHTHGGQVCLPGGVPILTFSRAPRRLARGPWLYRGMTGYTSAGCGTTIADVRLNCPPEVTLHRLAAAPPWPIPG